MYLYMLRMLAVICLEDIILKVQMKYSFIHACMLPSAGRMRALCNLRLQCLPALPYDT